uniref:Uncharacterized protein containing lysm domain-protein n=1 Tax=uncultured Vibrionales bacterium HF0010_22E23 TaxID=710999 RepID=E0XRH6_9GAMM|nr:uncharacterized protein containing lysm domain-protein [uncultured Vibrionales bacterium HF0010_22E23]
MLKKLFTAGVAGLLSFQAAAAVTLSDTAPDTYVVKKGDTLWDISALYLEKPWNWPALWKQNPDIKNPHLIYPGDTLSLVWHNGEPQLVKTNAGDSLTPLQALGKALMTPYLESDALISQAELALAPKVMGSPDGRQYFTGREAVYIDTELSLPEWEVYRPVSGFNRELGAHTASVSSLKHIASAKVVAAGDGRAKVKLSNISREVRANDVLLPKLMSEEDKVFYPKPASEGIDGRMIGHLYGSRYVGIRQVVVIDRGEEDGLSAGHTLAINEQGAAVSSAKGNFDYSDEKDAESLPGWQIGTLMVVKPYPHFSLAVVMEAEKPLSGDLPISSPK